MRAARAARIVDLRTRAVTEAQAALAEANRSLLAACARASEAEATWESYADAIPRNVDAAELARVNQYLMTLRRRADHAAQRVILHREEEQLRRDALRRARIEQRKIELWRDGILRASADHEKRVDRVASDEIAARIAQRER